MKRDSYQGMPSGVPPTAAKYAGFSPCAAAGKLQRLKPSALIDLAASLKRCPDTNLFPSCTIIHILSE